MLPLLFKIRSTDYRYIRMYVSEKDSEELLALCIVGHQCWGDSDGARADEIWGKLRFWFFVGWSLSQLSFLIGNVRC